MISYETTRVAVRMSTVNVDDWITQDAFRLRSVEFAAMH
jgi:hypothetical protein